MTDISKMSEEELEIEMKMMKVISQMPSAVQTRFKILHMLSDERSKMNDEFDLEVKKLNTKFAERKKPLLERRDQIVAGTLTEFPEEVAAFEASVPKLEETVSNIVKPNKGEDDSDEEEKPHEPTDVQDLIGKSGIPNFWALAAQNNQILMQTFRPKDKEVLPFLSGLHVERVEEPQSINLTLTFRENDWFTNEKLTVSVRYKEGTNDEIAETIGCLIDWKEGKDLSKKKIKKNQKNKKTGEQRQIVKTVPADTFFNVFESKKAPEGKDSDDEDEEAEKILDGLDEAMQIAEDLYDLYTRDGLEYYLNFG